MGTSDISQINDSKCRAYFKDTELYFNNLNNGIGLNGLLQTYFGGGLEMINVIIDTMIITDGNGRSFMYDQNPAGSINLKNVTFDD